MRETSRPRQFLPPKVVKLPLGATAHVVSWNSENRSFMSVVRRGFLVNKLQVSEPTGQGTLSSISADAELPLLMLGFHPTKNLWCYPLWPVAPACCEIQLEQLLWTQLGL